MEQERNKRGRIEVKDNKRKRDINNYKLKWEIKKERVKEGRKEGMSGKRKEENK